MPFSGTPIDCDQKDPKKNHNVYESLGRQRIRGRNINQHISFSFFTTVGQRQALRKTRSFPSLSHDGFGFNGIECKTPDKANFTLSGDKLAHFEVGLHGGSPKWRLGDWKEIYLLFQDKLAKEVKKNLPNNLKEL